MGLHPFFDMMANRTNAQITLQFFERLFDIGLQHILLPEFNGPLASLIGAQEISTIPIDHFFVYLGIKTKLEILRTDLYTFRGQFQLYTVFATTRLVLQHTQSLHKSISVTIILL